MTDLHSELMTLFACLAFTVGAAVGLIAGMAIVLFFYHVKQTKDES